MKKIAIGLMLLSVVGCGKVIEVAQQDLSRTHVLAEKYGKPEVKKCVEFLMVSVDEASAANVKLEALLKETTDGLLSAALKAALIAELVKDMQGRLDDRQFEAAFDEHCSAVAGKVFLALFRDLNDLMKKAATRGM